MKKITSIMLILLLAVTAVFANGAEESADTPAAAEEKSFMWWDHFLPLQEFHSKFFRESEAETGVKIEYTGYDPAKQKESMMLAHRTGNMPDVFSQTMGVSDLELYNENWFAPLAVNKEDLPEIVQNALFEGYTLFDGKVYSFPTMGPNYPVLLWYMDGIADDEVPHTFDEARALAKKITEESNGEKYGFILPIKFTGRMDETIEDLMQACGGPGFIDWTTGEYQYASDEMFEVFEFLTGLHDDGSVHPASVNLDMRAARERWAAGEAEMVFDGSWNIGVIKKNFSEVYDKVNVTGPVNADGSEYMILKIPPRGQFFISSDSDCVEEATNTLLKFMGEEYYIGLAEGMDQPPLDYTAVEKADVHPSYIKACEIFEDTIGFRPDPLLANKNVAEVMSEMKEIHPSPAEILQGYYAGAITDWKTELMNYNEAMTKERARAVEKIAAKGVDVSLDDWIFPNFKVGESFTTDKY